MNCVTNFFNQDYLFNQAQKFSSGEEANRDVFEAAVSSFVITGLTVAKGFEIVAKATLVALLALPLYISSHSVYNNETLSEMTSVIKEDAFNIAEMAGNIFHVFTLARKNQSDLSPGWR